MSGYTPVFADLYMGTLYGRWPAAAVWASLLPLFDKHGRLDMSPQAIAGMTGWPLALLEEGIRQLMEPDPNSRSGDEEGRRLVPLDPERPWGWIAVNHWKYREKARKMAYDTKRIESGQNAERQRAARASRRDPTRSDAIRDEPLSNANTNPLGGNPLTPLPDGLDGEAWGKWLEYRKAIRKPIKPASLLAAQQKLAGFGTDQLAVVEQSVANGWTGLFPLRQEGRKGRKTFEEHQHELARLAGVTT